MRERCRCKGVTGFAVVREFLARAERVPLDEAGRRASADTLTALRDLAAPSPSGPRRSDRLTEFRPAEERA